MRNDKLIPVSDERSIADNPPDVLETDAPAANGGARVVQEQQATPLFPNNESRDFRGRWERIQIGFVDEPRRAVQEADALVGDTMKRLTENFADERKKMEAVWDRGEDVSTEDLRIALQRYRSFFNRLLTL